MDDEKPIDRRNRIAKRVAKELKDGYVVNLGIGLPTMVADKINEHVTVLFQSENGLLGIQGMASDDDLDPDLVNAGGQPITAIQGAAYFDSAESFAIIRGGHVDVTVLGALQVDERGDLANWIIPGKMVPGMGGAMDLVVGAKKVIVAMEHTVKGKAKLLKRCTLPLTAQSQVNMIVTELGVIKITAEGMLLTEIADKVTIEEIKNATEATLSISPDLKLME